MTSYILRFMPKRMNCKTCLSWLGLTTSHKGDCPVRASAWCTQCGCYGHRSVDCSIDITWTRPATLEELIPEDVRIRWNITTSTSIQWASPLILEDKEREISDTNSIHIPYDDRKIRDFMKANKIHTTHKKQCNLRELREWAVRQGMKIVLDNSVTNV